MQDELLAHKNVQEPIGPTTLSDLPSGLFGVVTSARTGARVNGATVTVRGLAVVTDSNGIYSVANLRKETSLVEVSHPDYVNAERRVAIDRLLSPGDFKLEPKASDVEPR